MILLVLSWLFWLFVFRFRHTSIRGTRGAIYWDIISGTFSTKSNRTINMIDRNCRVLFVNCRTFKYLGVVFDNFMTWKAHADYVCKKVASKVSILGRVRSFVTKESVHCTCLGPK